LIAAIRVAVQRIEVERNDVPLPHRQVENRRPAD
jgi:hypothetical protein